MTTMPLPMLDFSLAGKRAVLATMHGKERVIRPLVEGGLRLKLDVPATFNTDRFGTFSRDIARTGSQLDAARAKIAAAFAHDPEAQVGIASEDSFGPHPMLAFVPQGREIVVLRDAETGLELVGRHADLQTNFAHERVESVDAARAFADRVGFPGHGVIVIGTCGTKPAPERMLAKDARCFEELVSFVEEAIATCGTAHVETDMRAHRNPTRMRAITRATIDLVRRYRSPCPLCMRPGFAVIERLAGLPCAWCGAPTNALRAEVKQCVGCNHCVVIPAEIHTAEPGDCNECNP